MVFLAFAESIQLLPDGTLFIHIAMILAMIWILNRTFFRPINRVIEAREKNKGGRSSEAESLLAQVKEKQERYNKEILDARSQGYGMIEKEKAAALSARETEINAVKDETASKFAQEKEEIQRESSAAKATIALEAEVIAEKISDRILNNDTKPPKPVRFEL
jgi:F-type H+-transporting ATPase subunit b